MIHQPCILVNREMCRIADSARIDSFVKIEGGQGCEIGEYVHIGSFGHINAGGGRTIIEERSGTASGVVICSGMPDLSFLDISAALPADQWRALRKETIIESYVVLFARSVILPGIRIGKGAIVGAGSVVRHDVPAFEIWAGNPAKCIGRRKIKFTHPQEWEALRANEYRFVQPLSPFPPHP